MKLGIIGRRHAGKTTVFEALCREFPGAGNKGETRIGTVRVPDPRIDELSRIFEPKKTIYAQVEYLLPGAGTKVEEGESPLLPREIRDTDALILVVRNFPLYGIEEARPEDEYRTMEQELILSDLAVTEKRLERMETERKKGKRYNEKEHLLLEECKKALDKGIPIRRIPELAEEKLLKGYAFVSAKPMLVLFNNTDEDESLPGFASGITDAIPLVIRAKLEHELAQMDEEEAAELLSEFNIPASAAHRVIQASYKACGLISFFTVGKDEVRAWTIKKGTCAQDAAGAIHTDMKKGFIRAEVVSYDDFIAAGSLNEAKKQGTLRMEGKTYIVADGDIITVRFNV